MGKEKGPAPTSGRGPRAEASDARWLRHGLQVCAHLSREVERPINRATCECVTVVVIEF